MQIRFKCFFFKINDQNGNRQNKFPSLLGSLLVYLRLIFPIKSTVKVDQDFLEFCNIFLYRCISLKQQFAWCNVWSDPLQFWSTQNILRKTMLSVIHYKLLMYTNLHLHNNQERETRMRPANLKSVFGTHLLYILVFYFITTPLASLFLCSILRSNIIPEICVTLFYCYFLFLMFWRYKINTFSGTIFSGVTGIILAINITIIISITVTILLALMLLWLVSLNFAIVDNIITLGPQMAPDVEYFHISINYILETEISD